VFDYVPDQIMSSINDIFLLQIASRGTGRIPINNITVIINRHLRLINSEGNAI